MKVLLARANSPLQAVPVPLGLGYLSHALKTRRNDQVLIMDGRRMRIDNAELARRALDSKPDLIGVTAMTFESPYAIDFIARVKDARPDLPVVIGGPHATAYGQTLLERIRADYQVMGEGEAALVGLADALEGKLGLDQVPGMVRREKGQVVFNGPSKPEEDMDRLDVDWESLDPTSYFSWKTRNATNTVARSSRRLPVSFSRGCPFGCSYCHHIFGRKYRTFSIDRIVDDMIAVRDRYGAMEFEVLDDHFNLHLDRAKEIMKRLIDRKVGVYITFTNGLRSDQMDEELLDLMVRAGVYRIDYAVESASPRIQKLIKKNLNLDRAREVIEMTARKRIITGAYYILGFPGETEEEMNQTVDYALSLKNHIASFFYLMPFPGTEIAEADPEISRRTREIDFHDASGIAINLSAVPDETLTAIKQRAYREFYFSPRRILRIARDVPKNFRLAASALDVLRLASKEDVNY